MKTITRVTLGVLALAPAAMFAANDVKPNNDLTFGNTTLHTFLTWVQNQLLAVTTVIAIIVIIYGGVMYMLSAGDATKAGKAKNVIMYGLIGVAVIAGAYFLISFAMTAVNKVN